MRGWRRDRGAQWGGRAKGEKEPRRKMMGEGKSRGRRRTETQKMTGKKAIPVKWDRY